LLLRRWASLTHLTVTRLGKVVIHKAKRNANLSFSKGKTWNLEDMRVVEVIGVSAVFTAIPYARAKKPGHHIDSR
jgi:hypothetical protein